MNLQAILALVVLSQLLLLVVILLAIDSPRIRTANRLLAAMLATVGLSLGLLLLKETELMLVPVEYRRVLHNISLAMGPLLFLYVRALVDHTFRLRAGHLLHFLPVPVMLLLSLPALGIYSDPVLGAKISTSDSPYLIRLSSVQGLLSTALGFAYCVASLGALRPFQQRLLDNFSTIEELSLKWLTRILQLFIAMMALLVPVLLIRLVSGRELNPVVYVVLPVGTLLLYYIAIAGFRWSQVFYREPVVAPLLTVAPVAEEPEAEALPEKPKYARSGLDEDALADCWARLQRLMAEDKPYLDDSLRLADIAQALAVSSQELSQVLNTCAGQNFYDYVNSCRAREAEWLLADPALRRRSLLEIAERAGFRSKSTFNKYFKNTVGLTPSEFRRRAAVG